ncbi:helix-turn-helix domain-containing protein, partial [Rhodohalobacter sp. 8-1]|uniref:helix-turn-helix domain-containing protein n=1 Tax=Rhodohalobacter sp. 8-1 TaxID=3131972 RepID=UPI0030EBE340
MAGSSAAGKGGAKSAKVKAPKAKTAPAKAGAKEIPIRLATGSSAPGTAEGQSIEEALGAQVRALRKRQDMTVAELAGQAGLSAGMLSKVENGA